MIIYVCHVDGHVKVNVNVNVSYLSYVLYVFLGNQRSFVDVQIMSRGPCSASAEGPFSWWFEFLGSLQGVLHCKHS